jgi:hypothetical protein
LRSLIQCLCKSLRLVPALLVSHCVGLMGIFCFDLD